MRTDDGSIIYECLNGEPGAFGLLVDKYKEGIYAYVYDKLRDFRDAQDVTQEVFLQAYRGLRSLRRWESFSFWLYRIASARCKLWIRTQSRRIDQDFIADQDPKILKVFSIDSYRDNQLSESVREALDSLPDTYREVLILYYFAGMNSVDIARAFGTSPTAIRHRLSRARARLKEEMITMMDTAIDEQKLPEGFTFRIVEAVKRIKIRPMPKATGLPWGLSLAAGIMIAAMTIGSQVVIHELPRSLALPGEMDMPRVQEIPVDILGALGTSVISGKQGDIDGGGMDPRNPQNSFLLAPAQGGGAWTQKADMPTARFIPGSAVVDGKIYVIGGAPVNFGITAVVEEYDPITDTWTRRADMPTARQGLCAAAVDGIIYAIGGWDGDPMQTTVEAYDPATDKWTKKADMPTSRTAFAIAVVDGIIYAFGGEHNGPALSAVDAYDPATDTWTRKADMPTARCIPAACVVDGRIYVFGGNIGNFWLPSTISTVEVYDPATDTWTQTSDMPWGRWGHSVGAVDGKIYIIGGNNSEIAQQFFDGEITMDEAIELHAIVDVYDPATDMWTTAADFPFPTTTEGGPAKHAAAVVDGKIYTIGGTWGREEAILSLVYEYDPGLPDNISVASPAGKLLGTWGEVKSE